MVGGGAVVVGASVVVVGASVVVVVGATVVVVVLVVVVVASVAGDVAVGLSVDAFVAHPPSVSTTIAMTRERLIVASTLKPTE